MEFARKAVARGDTVPGPGPVVHGFIRTTPVQSRGDRILAQLIEEATHVHVILITVVSGDSGLGSWQPLVCSGSPPFS